MRALILSLPQSKPNILSFVDSGAHQGASPIKGASTRVVPGMHGAQIASPENINVGTRKAAQIAATTDFDKPVPFVFDDRDDAMDSRIVLLTTASALSGLFCISIDAISASVGGRHQDAISARLSVALLIADHELPSILQCDHHAADTSLYAWSAAP
eukprot:CAMPEP_0178509868 /NCGR_PEP_ID=MMETSP0696-20121128/21517_1 /TAXON_ID=265572 /ORGANISM="Extubocellulus spinifer, Strain CCMP396" /LENGTH=156 /DNA_ID=CAMNT_0020139521 /DNA_START=251 /DNA_END=721 /DNA_ORIENTATION=-